MAQTLHTVCEYCENPLGIRTAFPRFSWTMPSGADQTAYQLRIYAEDGALLHDSGKTESSVSTGVTYAGAPLASATRYLYDVTVTLADGSAVTSARGSFETALLSQSDWQGQFIAAPMYEKRKSPMFLRQFDASDIQSARVYICGLGYYELFINGSRIGESVLEPGWTDYNKRVLYNVYDVSDIVKEGQNALGVMLGEGWMGHEHPFFMMTFGTNPSWLHDPCLLLNLHITHKDGSREVLYTAPDGKWLACQGPITMNNIYDGETYDARLEQDGWDMPGFAPDSRWAAAVAADAPKGKLDCTLMPPIRQHTKLRPKCIYRPGERTLTYDMGQNIAGWVQIRVRGPKGGKVTLKFAEHKYDDHTVNQQNLRNAKATDTYICKGDYVTEIYKPRFTYHGFRYVEVTVEDNVRLENLVGYRVNNTVERAGHFSCSSELLNKIYNTVVDTELNNLHSVPTDCPQRDERLAWINDMTVRFEEAMFNFDMKLFYEKWLRDIEDAQSLREDGSIGDTAPYFYGGFPACHISSVYTLLPWYMFLFYQDITPLADHYDGMKRYTQFKLTQLDEKGLVNGNYAGDWAPPMSESIFGYWGDALCANIHAQLITTGYLYLDCITMAKAAMQLNHPEDASYFSAKAEVVKNSINNAFLDREHGCYTPSSQGSNLFPLFLGIVPEEEKPRVAKALLDDLILENDYHITTGNQTTKLLFETLSLLGQNEVAVKVLEKEDYPSFGYMFKCGATSIWERWENTTGIAMNSHNHPMHGAFSVWYFKALAGIRPCDEAVTGYITIKPDFVENLESAGADYRTAKGVVACSWKRSEGHIQLSVTVPWNSKAKLILPENAGFTVNGKAAFGTEQILSSGSYTVVL